MPAHKVTSNDINDILFRLRLNPNLAVHATTRINDDEGVSETPTCFIQHPAAYEFWITAIPAACWS